MTTRNLSALLLIFLIIAFLLPGGYAGAQQKKPAKPSVPTYTISEALEKGKIAVEAEGAGLSVVSVTIKKTTQEKFKVLIPVGTYFVAKGNYQSMVSRGKVIADLTVNKEFTVSVPASCANASKEVPRKGDKFDIALSPQAEDLRKLMEVIAKKNPGEVVTQVAVWIVTDDISRGTLDSRYRRFRGFAPVLPFAGGGEPAASDEDVIKAMALVEEAGIDLKEKVIYKEKISAISGLTSKNKTIQNLSLRFLNAEGKDRIEVLVEALKDENSSVRGSAAEALEKINPKWRETEEAKKWVPVFISDLKSKSLGTREAAVYALGELKDPRAVEPLIEALKDKDWSVRKRAVEALGKLKDPRAVEPLIEALKDEVWNVRRSAADALQEITGQHFGRDPEKWQKWWEENKGRFINRTQ
jgi:hypothetical protein